MEDKRPRESVVWTLNTCLLSTHCVPTVCWAPFSRLGVQGDLIFQWEEVISTIKMGGGVVRAGPSEAVGMMQEECGAEGAATGSSGSEME